MATAAAAAAAAAATTTTSNTKLRLLSRYKQVLRAATEARRRILSAAESRGKVEQEMAAWGAAQAAQAAYDDDAEVEAAAGCEPAHARTIRLARWAARFWRTRPMVEARTYDGKPLGKGTISSTGMAHLPCIA